jgi:hypothetical protein
MSEMKIVSTLICGLGENINEIKQSNNNTASNSSSSSININNNNANVPLLLNENNKLSFKELVESNKIKTLFCVGKWFNKNDTNEQQEQKEKYNRDYKYLMEKLEDDLIEWKEYKKKLLTTSELYEAVKEECPDKVKSKRHLKKVLKQLKYHGNIIPVKPENYIEKNKLSKKKGSEVEEYIPFQYRLSGRMNRKVPEDTNAEMRRRIEDESFEKDSILKKVNSDPL